MSKLLLNLLLILCISLQVNAQKDSLQLANKHCLKLRIINPILAFAFINENGNKNFGLSYEQSISKKRSFNVALDYDQRYLISWAAGADKISYSRGITVYPEYRFYPFNRKKIYPRGFFISPSLNIGIYKGWNRTYYNASTSVNYYSVSYTTNPQYDSDFLSGSGGLGAVLGWQYFMGKRKRLVFSFAFSVYANKNYTFVESRKIRDEHRMYPETEIRMSSYAATYLGYTFGK
jgi:hypothetical protein